MSTIAANLQAVKSRIAAAERTAGRSVGAVTLLAVSKTFAATAVQDCAAAGQGGFGENYLQEALDKIGTLRKLDPGAPELEWHFIGPIQSNKARSIAENFHWVHSVERERIALRLDAARPPTLPRLNVCIQVNISGEASKSGVAPDEVGALAQAIRPLPRLKLRGLMAIPEPTPDTALRRQRFALLRELQNNLITQGHALDTLSMGMSDDLEDAIAEGATMVRVGTAIFGRRA
ncbi:MAG TPA: YggS family pyridoxal phosphate-dependent enzyme [Burkholderiales bacterium]|nr:YggS family pyridoxal phosphate-dependent enzyme [Burkholderiales bacterium]